MKKHLLNFLVGAIPLLVGVLITLGIYMDWTPEWAAVIFTWMVLVPAIYFIGYMIRDVMDDLRKNK